MVRFTWQEAGDGESEPEGAEIVEQVDASQNSSVGVAEVAERLEKMHMAEAEPQLPMVEANEESESSDDDGPPPLAIPPPILPSPEEFASHDGDDQDSDDAEANHDQEVSQAEAGSGDEVSEIPASRATPPATSPGRDSLFESPMCGNSGPVYPEIREACLALMQYLWKNAPEVMQSLGESNMGSSVWQISLYTIV